jgi:holo-[acyl-carrier protein] synthase
MRVMPCDHEVRLKPNDRTQALKVTKRDPFSFHFCDSRLKRRLAGERACCYAVTCAAWLREDQSRLHLPAEDLQAPSGDPAVIVGLGVDLFEVNRLERKLQTHGADFGDGLFTPDEIAYCESQHHPAQHYAARFAAKEALLKALAFDGREGIRWREAEVRVTPEGSRELVLHGALKELAERRLVRRIFLSLSHTPDLAAASVILET